MNDLEKGDTEGLCMECGSRSDYESMERWYQPVRSPHHERRSGIGKAEETFPSVVRYTRPGFDLFFFLVQLYTLLNRHVNPHITDENTEVQRDE